MAFKLSGRSLNKLEGVNPLLVNTVKRAIEVSSVDFGVIYGVRSLAEQKKLYKAGRSQTMKSRHLIQQDGTSYSFKVSPYLPIHRSSLPILLGSDFSAPIHMAKLPVIAPVITDINPACCVVNSG